MLNDVIVEDYNGDRNQDKGLALFTLETDEVAWETWELGNFNCENLLNEGLHNTRMHIYNFFFSFQAIYRNFTITESQYFIRN